MSKLNVKALLACSQGRRDEAPNIELAKKIAAEGDETAVADLVDLLRDKDKNIQSDSIKALGETAAIDGALVSKHLDVFIALLKSKNNRLQWGAMAVLDEITTGTAAAVYKQLPEITLAADHGSVITKDRFVNLLTKLAGKKKYTDSVIPLLFEQILRAPLNQAGQYAEKTLRFITEENKNTFRKILDSRLSEMEKENHIRRLQKILKRL